MGVSVPSAQIVHSWWTLQELLAPLSVEFFIQSGQRLGDKIAGITVKALCENELSLFDTEERFEWAEKREITEEDDWAYCLRWLLHRRRRTSKQWDGLGNCLSLLEDEENVVVDLLSEDFEDKGRFRDLKNLVATAWLMSLEQERQRNADWWRESREVIHAGDGEKQGKARGS